MSFFTESTAQEGSLFVKDIVAQELSYGNSDSNVTINHGLTTGSICLSVGTVNLLNPSFGSIVTIAGSTDGKAAMYAPYCTVTQNLSVIGTGLSNVLNVSGPYASVAGTLSNPGFFLGANASMTGTVTSTLLTSLNASVSGTTSSVLLAGTAMTLTGSAVIGNSLTVGSVLTSYTLSGTYLGLNGSAVLAGNLTASGTVSSALAVVSNSLQGTSLTLSNSALIGGSCTVGSSVIAPTIVGTTLTISGSATAALAVVSNTLQGTSLSIANSASIANSLTVGSSVASYTISGTTLALNGNASVTGTVTAALHNGGAMSLTGGGNIGGSLAVGSVVSVYTLSGTYLTINGNASVTGTVTAALHNGGAMSLTGGGNVGGSLAVGSAVSAYTLSGTSLSVAGAASVSGAVIIGSSLALGTVLQIRNQYGTVSLQTPGSTSTYSLTVPLAPPASSSVPYVDATGSITWNGIPISTVYNQTAVITNAKLWVTSGATANGTLTVYPTSNNTATGTALFGTILSVSAVVGTNTTTINSVQMCGLRSISSDQRTIIFNVIQGNTTGFGGGAAFAAASSGSTLYITLLGV
jgi:hypothetical protein